MTLAVWAFLARRAERTSEADSVPSAATPALPSAPSATLELAADTPTREKEQTDPAAQATAAPAANAGEFGPHALAGHVHDDQGRAVLDYELHAELAGSAARPPVELAVRERDGHFRLDGLVAGRWSVSLRAAGLSGKTLVVDVPRAEPLEVVLDRRARVRGLVSGPDGLACGEVDLHCDRNELQGALPYPGRRVARTARDGAFECDVPAGAFTLHARGVGFAPSQNLYLELEPGEVRDDVELRLRPGGRIVGEVLGFDGQPLGGTIVRVSEDTGAPDALWVQSTQVEADGRFEFGDVPAGVFELFAQLEGLQLREFTRLEPGGVAQVRLQPELRLHTRLRGRVTFAGRAHERVQVVLEPPHSDPSRRYVPVASAECDAEGDYALRAPSGADYLLRVVSWSPQFLSAQVALTLPVSPEHTFDVDLATGRVRGTVHSSDGVALVGAEVELVGADELAPHRTEGRTREDGSFELEAVAGELVLQVRGPQHLARKFVPLVRRDLHLARGEVLAGVDVELPVAGSLTGVVRFEDGTPAEGAALYFKRGASWEHVGWSGRHGQFALDELAAGEERLAATLERHSTRKDVSVQVVEGRATPLELTLVAYTEGVLRVNTASEEPVAVSWIDDLGETRNLQVRAGEELALGALFTGRHHFSAQVGDQSHEVIAIVRGSEPELRVELTFD